MRSVIGSLIKSMAASPATFIVKRFGTHMVVGGIVLVAVLSNLLRPHATWAMQDSATMACGDADCLPRKAAAKGTKKKAEAVQGPFLQIKDNSVLITQQEQLLFILPLIAPDRAYLAGRCLLVQRGAVSGELYPTVKQGEVYDVFTRQKTVHPGDEARYWGGNVFSPPSAKWAVMMRDEEGITVGYFYFGENCSITDHKFETQLFDAPCGTENVKAPAFGDDESLTLSSRRENEGKRCFTVVIHPDGTNEMKEMSKE